MPEYPIRDSILTSLNAQEPWPDNVKLFQPYEVEQILLPDNASCLAVQAFLKMCNLPFEVEMRWNAEFMSPSGRVPFIKCGAFVVSELEPIAQFAANKGVTLCGRLSTEEKAEMRAYMSLITNVLVNAELYISWIDNDTFHQVTKVRNSSVYPWPLGWFQTRAKRNNVAKRLKAMHWHDKTLEQVLADVEQCCNSLSQRLGDKEFFFGTPTQLDALLFGHVRALLSARGPKAGLTIKPITSVMLRHAIRLNAIVGMKLTPQEDYLLTQAFQPYSSKISTISEKSERNRRSKITCRMQSRDSINKDLFGFKPFASKQFIIMTSNEGAVTCFYDELGNYANYPCISEEEYHLIVDIIEDILDKVEETVIDGFNERFELDSDKGDFEVIAFPNRLREPKTDYLGKLDEMLEPSEDKDHIIDDATMSLDGGLEDVMQIISEDTECDSDGVINEKHLDSNTIAEETADDLSPLPMSPQAKTPDCKSLMTPELTDSSNNEHIKNLYLNESKSEDKVLKIMKSESSLRSSLMSTDSKSTLKMPSDEEISVENLLNYLRKRNAAYNIYPEIDDLD